MTWPSVEIAGGGTTIKEAVLKMCTEEAMSEFGKDVFGEAVSKVTKV
jgi:hypothetical protein